MHCGDLWWDSTQWYICKLDTYCILVTCAGMVYAGNLKHCRVVVTPIKASLHDDDDEMMMVMMMKMWKSGGDIDQGES